MCGSAILEGIVRNDTPLFVNGLNRSRASAFTGSLRSTFPVVMLALRVLENNNKTKTTHHQ